MTSKQALARLVAPTGKTRRRPQRVGDGDPCPIVPKHGLMLVTGPRQRCPHQSHDLTGTRVSWPSDITPEQLARLAMPS